MIGYTEESHGVFATCLYEAAACASTIDYVKRLNGWESATVREEGHEGSYQSADRPESRTASILISTEGYDLIKQFESKIDDIIKPLIKQIYGINLVDHSGTQLVRYKPGGHYAVHADAGFDLQSRYFSVLCYLNSDFEGGHTSFPSLNYSVIPESGKAIVFPSQYLHCAEPVTKGEKYVLVAWVDGPATIKWL